MLEFQLIDAVASASWPAGRTDHRVKRRRAADIRQDVYGLPASPGLGKALVPRPELASKSRSIPPSLRDLNDERG